MNSNKNSPSKLLPLTQHLNLYNGNYDSEIEDVLKIWILPTINQNIHEDLLRNKSIEERQYCDTNNYSMSTNVNSAEELTLSESNHTQINDNNKLSSNLNHIMKQLSRKMCKQYLLPDEYTELESELEKSLNIAESSSNTVLYAKFKSDNQSLNHKKVKHFHTKNNYEDLNNFEKYQYKDFGYGISQINGENLEYILNGKHTKSPGKQIYDNIVRKVKSTHVRNGKKIASTQVVCKHKYCEDAKLFPSNTCTCSSICAPECSSRLATHRLENDLNKLTQQTGDNADHNTGNNEQTSICLENITPFSLTECPLLMDLYAIHKETTNSLSNQKDSACESDNLSSLNGELYPFKNSLEFLKSPSHQSLPKIINYSTYTSVMWESLMKLLNHLINEERLFWHKELLNRNKSNNSEVETIDIKSLLSDIDRFYSEEFRLLWKQVYESWVPRDYLQYFSDETRKVFINLNLVIEKLLSFIEKGNYNTSSSHSHIGNLENSDCFKSYSKKCFTNQDSRDKNHRSMINSRLSHSCSSLNKIQNNGQLFNDQHLEYNESKISFKHMRELFKLSHQQLLEQIYHVTEMVGAALDTDMEDAINGVHISAVNNHKNMNDNQSNNITSDKLTTSGMLTNPSTPGLQVVAKLLSAILDLETRLDTICENQIIAENITNSEITFDYDQCGKNYLKYTPYLSSDETTSSSVQQGLGFQIKGLQNPKRIKVIGDILRNRRYKREHVRSPLVNDHENNFRKEKQTDLDE
ncbi:unnamed protein product [Schistosoma mattheei]|uniref:Uncharacterized protein n=1 Tax=Schistosoma mattheei TaxID=31246 RepID=A0AA85BTJ5_9TREM|nr:unnamed protein product [Schistosoma mattheei]